MTTQEAFERQLEWFSRPGAKLGVTLDKDTGEPNAGCAYRGGVMRGKDESGLHSVGFAGSDRRCVVGCLIPDVAYARYPQEGSLGGIIERIEGEEIEDLLAAWGLGGIDRGWLENSQGIHDQLATHELLRDLSNEDELVRKLVAQLKDAGEAYGLKVPVSS